MERLIVTVTSYLCTMDNLPLYWYYWLMMQTVARNLIVTAGTASCVMATTSVKAGQSSRPEYQGGYRRTWLFLPSGGQQVFLEAE